MQKVTRKILEVEKSFSKKDAILRKRELSRAKEIDQMEVEPRSS